MPENDTENGGALAPAKARVEGEQPATSEITLPSVKPPQTIAPIQFNQQVNLSIQQIPPSAWDRLTAEQIMDISKAIIKQADAADQRQYDYAMEDIRRSSAGKRMAVVCGSLVTAAGYGIAGYLAAHGQSLVAACIVLPITTVLAVIVGNRFLDRS